MRYAEVIREASSRQARFSLADMRRVAATPDVELKLSRETRETTDEGYAEWCSLGLRQPVVRLDWIKSTRKGAGAEALRKLVAFADLYGVTLFGWAEDDGRNRLVNYYREFGFEPSEHDSNYIVRDPTPR